MSAIDADAMYMIAYKQIPIQIRYACDGRVPNFLSVA